MKFETLHFYERNFGNVTELGMRVRGYWVRKSTFELTHELIHANRSTLVWEKPLQSRDICHHAHWDSWLFSLRHNIGRCLRLFSEEGIQPLQIVNPNKGGPRLYMPM